MTTSTWNSTGTGNWNTATNWTPTEVPTTTAKLGQSSQMTVTVSASCGIGEIKIESGAPAYTFSFTQPGPTPWLTISGAGVDNKSTHPVTFDVATTSDGYSNPQLVFTGSASAGGPTCHYYAQAGTAGYGGGVIAFLFTSTAGSAQFFVKTGGGAPPKQSNVGGEVIFNGTANAGTATFEIHGSETTVDQGYTFGSVVFHGKSSAAKGTFHNVGGKVSGGDGGNTQFYENALASHGTFHNHGGTFSTANGGDVAFDGSSNGVDGEYHNYAAPTAGAHGGVTSFNNNPDTSDPKGHASAGKGRYHNYGAEGSRKGGGGHTEFTAKYGSPTAEDGTFYNHGSDVAEGEGYTSFSGESRAAKAKLYAYKGSNCGGKIAFYDKASGDEATVTLAGNGQLSIGYYTGEILHLATLDVTEGGIISTQVGKKTPKVELSKELTLGTTKAHFAFSKGDGFETGKSYALLRAPNLSKDKERHFSGSLDGYTASFRVEDDTLHVSFTSA